MVGGVEEDDAKGESYESREERMVYTDHRFEYVEAVPHAAPYEYETDHDIYIADEV